MQVRDLMKKGVVTIDPQETIKVAAEKMRNANIGCLVVTNTNTVKGIITDRDEVVGQGLAPASVPVESVMSSSILSLHEEDGLPETLTQMAARGVRRAPVMDRNGHIKGLVSVDDFLPLLVRECAKIAALLRREQAGEERKTEDIFPDEFGT